ncbi:hypothetical protein PENTCL1PPCAC_7577, partial [Pristionchus entomophagus]
VPLLQYPLLQYLAMAASSSSIFVLALLMVAITVDAGTWLSFSPGMSGVNDLDLSGLSNFKLTRHTRNVANLLDVCAESSRRMAKRAAAGIVTNQDRTTSKFCDYLITMHEQPQQQEQQ